MSRVGKMPITVPQGVDVKIAADQITIKGAQGTLVRAGSVVRGEFPDFAVLEGRPARVVGDTRDADAALLAAHPAWRPLREAWAGPPAPAQPPRP